MDGNGGDGTGDAGARESDSSAGQGRDALAQSGSEVSGAGSTSMEAAGARGPETQTPEGPAPEATSLEGPMPEGPTPVGPTDAQPEQESQLNDATAAQSLVNDRDRDRRTVEATLSAQSASSRALGEGVVAYQHDAQAREVDRLVGEQQFTTFDSLLTAAGLAIAWGFSSSDRQRGDSASPSVFNPDPAAATSREELDHEHGDPDRDHDR